MALPYVGHVQSDVWCIWDKRLLFQELLVCWNIMSCSQERGHRCSGERCSLHLREQEWKQCLSTELDGVMYQKIFLLILSTLRTFQLTIWLEFQDYASSFSLEVEHLEIYSTFIPVTYLQGGSSKLCILNLYDLFFRKKYKCGVQLMSCFLHIKECFYNLFYSTMLVQELGLYRRDILHLSW